MNQFQLNLSNTQQEEILRDVIRDIDKGITEEDQFIVEDLELALKDMNSEDKVLALRFLNLHYENRSFLELGNFLLETKQENIDFEELYQLCIKERNHQVLINILLNKEFRERNRIPEIMINNLSSLQKLENGIIDIFLIMEDQRTSQFHQFELLINLIKFIFQRLDLEETQRKVEMVIGSLLFNQVYEFQFFLEKLQEKNTNFYLEYVNQIRNMQLMIPLNQNQLEKDSELDLKFLAQLLTSDLQQSKKNLDKYIRYVFEIEYGDLTFESISIKLKQYISQGIDIKNCYYMVVWYLWLQYVCQPEFLSKLEIHQGKLSQIPDYQKRLKQSERFLLSLTKESSADNQLQNYLLKNIVLFDFVKFQSKEYIQFKEKLNIQLSDHYAQYLKVQSFQDIITMGNEQFCALWQATNRVPYNFLLFQQYQEETVKNLILLFWRHPLIEETQRLLRIISKIKSLTLFQCAELIEDFLPEKSNQAKVTLIFISAKIKQLKKNSEISLIKYYLDNLSFDGAQKLQLFNEIIMSGNKGKINLKILSEIAVGYEQIIFQYINQEQLEEYMTEVCDFYINQISDKNQYIQKILSQFLPHVVIKKQEGKLECFLLLLENQEHHELHMMFLNNRSNCKPNLEDVEKTFFILMNVYDKIVNDARKLESIFFNLNYFIKQELYHFNLIFQLKSSRVENDLILKIIKVFYFNQTKNYDSLQLFCEDIIQQNLEYYSYCFENENYFNNFQLNPIVLKQVLLKKQYTLNIKLTLENFSFSLAGMDKQEMEKLVSDWLKQTNDEIKFIGLVPFFFNIIKRGESPKTFITYVNSNKPLNLKENFNLKSLFQIFYNNCNDELKTMLLKFRISNYSVPFLYKNLNNHINIEDNLHSLNSQLFYVFPSCYTIINFTLSKITNQIGKTSLINEIFYEEQNQFQISDSSDINKNTIDIMFDNCFNGSRQLAIADAHGQFSISILGKLLPLFQVWIIQLDSEKEIPENLKELQKFDQIIKLHSPQICFIVRNSSSISFLSEIQELHLKNIQIHFMRNLIEKKLDLEIKTKEIDNVSLFLMQRIQMVIINSKQKNQFDFLEIMKQFDFHCQKQVYIMQQELQILNETEKHLHYLVQQPDGFFNNEAFPIRSSDHKKKQLIINQMNQNQLQTQIQLEPSEKSEILNLFCKIFSKENYYILYLMFVDRIRQFNDMQTKFFYTTIENLNNQLLENKKASKIQDKEKIENLKLFDEKESLKKKIREVQENLFSKNIGIEIFWREVIVQYAQSANNSLNFNPSKYIYEMIQKGEPFEFLDGDDLKINTQFLQSIVSQFEQKGEEKILVLSILGPQSTGKSTLLNKIFGCHFWTSAGRCTKGIYIQLLKIQNNQLFNGQFDYILLLDTEGLQNPNQKDIEFDKKIALFILQLSDIIILNVKGEIQQSFKDLVEMCIYTLGQLNRTFQFIKTLSWCFNQNSHTNDCDPYLQSIDKIALNLNLEFNKEDSNESKIDYNDILEINSDNIKVLGVSQVKKNWKYNSLSDSFSKCQQLLVIETFSQEAYAYGLKTISNFQKKLKTQDDGTSMQSLSNFILNVEANWNGIQKLPDLLEFSELIQFQQNNFMSKQFDLIKRGLIEELSFIGSLQNVVDKEIQSILTAPESKNNLNLQQIFESQIKDIQNNLDSLKLTAQEQLSGMKTQNKISKKILKKYDDKLIQFIKEQYHECRTIIYSVIQNKQIQYSKQQGMDSINEFISKIYKDEDQLKLYQKDNQILRDAFNKIWSNIEKQQMDEQQIMFEDFQSNQLNMITSNFPQFTFTQKQSESLRDMLRKKNQQNPDASDEKQKIFEALEPELITLQFMQLDKNRHYKHIDQFIQNIQNKLNSSSNHLISISLFYKYNVSWVYFTYEKIQKYLTQDQFFLDMYKIIQLKDEKKAKTEVLKQIYDFFIILEQFDVNYKREDYEKLIETIRNSVSKQELQQIFKQFQLTFQFQKDKQIQIRNKEFLSLLTSYYQLSSTKIHSQNFSVDTKQEYEKIKLSLFVQGIIIEEKIEVVPKNDPECFFSYIKSPLEEKYSSLNSKMPHFFQSKMKEMNGWQKLYYFIYDFINHEISKLIISRIYKNQGGINSDDENIIFCNNSIRNIMEKVIQKVDELNLQFSTFGVVLNSVGERCIYYFSILIIWRFGCYKYWQKLEKHQIDLKMSSTEQFNMLETQIKKDKKKQSQAKAEILVKLFYDEIVKEIYNQAQNLAKNIIDQDKRNSRDVIADLDKRFLDLDYENNPPNEELSFQIFQYLTDQKKSIEIYADEKIETLRNTIEKQLEHQTKQTYKDLLQKTLNDLINNAGILRNAQISDEQYIRNYFGQDKQLQDDKFYEQKLYSLVFAMLLGKKNIDYKELSDKYRATFQLKYQQIALDISDKANNKTNQEIQSFHTFLDTVKSKLITNLQNITDFRVDIDKLCLKSAINTLKLEMLGCLYSCPICGRKCDHPDVKHEKHECYHGHQLRGMNQILIGTVPSLLMCEEMKNEYLIKNQNTDITKTWANIIKENPNWTFRNINQELNNQNCQRMLKIWNSGVGRIMCDQMTKIQQKNIYYREKHYFDNNNEKLHYIFMIDGSGKMSGKPRERAESCFKNCINQLVGNQNAKASVITFKEKPAIYAEMSSPKDAQSRWWSQWVFMCSGQANYDSAYLQAFDLVKKHKKEKFSRIIIFMFTTGDAPYPSHAIRSFQSLDLELRSSITLVVSSEIQKSAVLSQIVEAAKPYCQETQYLHADVKFQLYWGWGETIAGIVH